MNAGDSVAGVAVVIFGGRRVPGPLRDLPAHRSGGEADLDSTICPYRRLVVVGGDADLAAVLTRLLRARRLDIEIAYAPPRRTRATRVYRLPSGHRAARRALRGLPRRVTLVRDETGSVIVGRARWLPAGDRRRLRGEAVIDDTVLFDGEVTAVCIEPTPGVPGLRARVRWWHRWIAGRAAQLGSTGVTVVRDGVVAPRTAPRSTFYRHVEGWLLVR